MKQLSAIGAVTLLVLSCTKGDKDGEDRTVQRLRALQQKEAAAATPPPTSPTPGRADTSGMLAQQVAGGASLETEIPVAHESQVRAGLLGVTLTKVSTMHSVTSSRIKLTTNDFFLRTVIAVVNNGEQPIAVNWAAAKVAQDKTEWPVAADAQRAGGSRELSAPLRSGEKRDVVLYFETPENGWAQAALVLPAGAGADGEVRIPF